MASWQRIMKKRIAAAKRRVEIGKPKKSDLRLLAKQELREARKQDQTERLAAFDYAVSKE